MVASTGSSRCGDKSPRLERISKPRGNQSDYGKSGDNVLVGQTRPCELDVVLKYMAINIPAITGDVSTCVHVSRSPESDSNYVVEEFAITHRR